MTGIEVGDAFVRGSADGSTWTVGSEAVALTYEARDGGVTLTSFQNKLACPPVEYVPEGQTNSGLAGGPWLLRDATASETSAGGQPVALLTLELTREGLTARLHVIVFPGTSILRQWVELDNNGSEPLTAPATLLTLALADNAAAPFDHYLSLIHI